MRKSKPPQTPEATSTPVAAPSAASTVQKRPVVVTDEPVQSLTHEDALRQLAEGLTGSEEPETPTPETDDEQQAPVEGEGEQETENLTDPDAETEVEARDGEDVDDEDIEELAELSEEQLTAHGQEKGWPPSYTKRVKKFTRKLREAQAKAEGVERLREEREAMRERLESLEGKAPKEEPVQSGDQQIGQFDKQLTEIDQQIDQLHRNLIWAKRNPEGGTLRTADGKTVEADADYVASLQDNWELKIRQLERESSRLIAKRETRAAQVESEQKSRMQENAKKALELYPWLRDPKSKEWKEADKFVRENPEIRSLPNWPLIVGQIVAGKTVTATNGNGHPRPVSKPPSRPAAAPLPAKRSDNGSAAISQAMKSGDRKDAELAVLSLVEGRR